VLPLIEAHTVLPPIEEVTLKDILEQEDVFQECMNQNKKPVEYLCAPDILSELISLVMSGPATELSTNLRFKMPHIAAMSEAREEVSKVEKATGALTTSRASSGTAPKTLPLSQACGRGREGLFQVQTTQRSEAKAVAHRGAIEYG